MTREEQIKSIREKCVAANPQIVELKFGCSLVRKDADIGWNAVVTNSPRYRGGTGYEYFSSDHWNQIQQSTEQITDEYEIIGRPIRLADVLLAMNDHAPLACSHSGGFLKGGREWKYREPVVRWNLRADDLEQQSDECIEFIHSLLSV